VNTIIQDLRYGIRMLARNPGFTAVAVLTLALGIGANTAIFSVVNGVLLNPLPYFQPDRLVALYTRDLQFTKSSISYPNFLDWVRDNHSFSGLAAYAAKDFNLTGMGEPERLPGDMISAGFFGLLGVKPVVGRPFRPGDDHVGAAPVVLISGGLWKRKFGSSSDVLGKTLTLNGTAYTVIGVTPSHFYFHGDNFQRGDVYVPIGQWNDPTFRDRRVGMGMDAVGRLKPGVTFGQAKGDMDALGRHLAEEYPNADKGTGITLAPLKQDVVGDIQPYLLLLLAAVGFVLLIACVNVANLSLARASARMREFAIRIAVGAGRGRVIRQLLTESVLLALAGGALGLMVASWGLQAALKLLPEALPRTQDVRLDGHVLLFTLAASMLVGILFGLAPALKISTANSQKTLKEGGRGSSAARHRTQSAFVVVEMALAVVLLAGAGLMIRTLAKLWSVDPGFDPHHVLTFNSSFPPLKSPDAIRANWREAHDKLSTIPGVQAASLSLTGRPLGSDSELPFWVEGQPRPATDTEMNQALYYAVQPDYLKVMRIPLERGRFLSPADNAHSPFVAVIDKNFARLYFHGQNPIGKRVNFDILNVTAEIVGVVGHVKQWGLDENARSPVLAQCYLPIAQIPDRFLALAAGTLGVVVRTAESPLAEVSSIRHAMDQVNSRQAMFGTETMDRVVSDSISTQRFSMILMAIFAALALVMATVGIYGVVAYVTSQRTHEMGIRIALGAQRSDVLKLVLRDGSKLTLIGVGIGIAGAIGLTRFLANMLFGVKPTDTVTFVAVSLILTGVALLACYIPARRATKVDPVVALRYE
jgi:predicted permease